MFLLILILGIVSLWDGFTTLFGALQIFEGKVETLIPLISSLQNGQNPLEGKDVQVLIPSILLSLAILGFLLATSYIWETGQSSLKVVLIIIWIVATGFDLYTSFIGNLYFILRGEYDTASPQFALLIGLTLVVSSSPMLLSVIYRNKD